MIRAILFPTDFSAVANSAFPLALAVAAQYDAIVQSIHIAHGVTVGSQVPLDIATTGAGPSHRYGLPSLPLYVPRGYADLNLVAEDRATMEAVQRNIGSLGYGEGRFSYDPAHGETSEEAVHRFHWLVARTLGLQASENA